MPDDQNSVRKHLSLVRDELRTLDGMLLGELTQDDLFFLRQGLELSRDRLQFVRDWVDERLR